MAFSNLRTVCLDLAIHSPLVSLVTDCFIQLSGLRLLHRYDVNPWRPWVRVSEEISSAYKERFILDLEKHSGKTSTTKQENS